MAVRVHGIPESLSPRVLAGEISNSQQPSLSNHSTRHWSGDSGSSKTFAGSLAGWLFGSLVRRGVDVMAGAQLYRRTANPNLASRSISGRSSTGVLISRRIFDYQMFRLRDGFLS